MITLPNYDDQTFQEIMEMARRRIPVIYPQWTDLNEHDPGITILELFAWLKEMQQYHLNRITTQSYESMLKLLGITVQEPAASQIRVAFPDIAIEKTLPQGLPFKTEGGIVFECQDSVYLNNIIIQGVYVSDGKNFIDVKDMVMEPRIYCHAFGEKPIEGESAFYIGLDHLDTYKELNLHLQIDDSYPVPRTPFKDDLHMPRDVVWEYCISDEKGYKFIPVESIKDNTYGFSQSGNVCFKFLKEVFSVSLGDEMPKCCWLRARLVRKGCEENPRIKSIYFNTTMLSQKETHCQMLKLTLNNYSKNAIFELKNWLAIEGEHVVFVRDNIGWYIHNDCNMQNSSEEGIRLLNLENIPESIALDGYENIRVLCYKSDFSSSMVLQGSNGLPCQRFYFDCKGTILRNQLSVMVYEDTEEGEKRWTDWRFTPKLAGCGPYDRCFTFDRSTGEIVFGDNEHGAVPTQGENNIIITGCITTKGSGGNIGQQNFEITEFAGLKLKPYSPYQATGGMDAENTKDTIERFKASLTKCKRAVTALDYETLAASTPGLRVMGVHAIPYYSPESKVAGGKQAAATVTVVVLPYNDEPYPKPDRNFLEAIENYLENYRLITTNVKVIGADYIKISVYAEIILESSYSGNINDAVRKVIDAYFISLQKGTQGKKPEFGQPVRENIITMKITDIPGVTYVKKVVLGVRNSDSYRDKYGNIIIPPYGLPCLGDLQIHALD